MPPPVALTVAIWLPAGALGLALSVSTLVPEPGAATVAGEKVGVTPAGRPLTDSATGELNPALPVENRTTATLPPCWAVTNCALEARLRFGGGSTVTTSGKVVEVGIPDDAAQRHANRLLGEVRDRPPP